MRSGVTLKSGLQIFRIDQRKGNTVQLLGHCSWILAHLGFNTEPIESWKIPVSNR
jgi:hypothetical protein